MAGAAADEVAMAGEAADVGWRLEKAVAEGSWLAEEEVVWGWEEADWEACCR